MQSLDLTKAMKETYIETKKAKTIRASESINLLEYTSKSGGVKKAVEIAEQNKHHFSPWGNQEVMIAYFQYKKLPFHPEKIEDQMEKNKEASKKAGRFNEKVWARQDADATKFKTALKMLKCDFSLVNWNIVAIIFEKPFQELTMTYMKMGNPPMAKVLYSKALVASWTTEKNAKELMAMVKFYIEATFKSLINASKRGFILEKFDDNNYVYKQIKFEGFDVPESFSLTEEMNEPKMAAAAFLPSVGQLFQLGFYRINRKNKWGQRWKAFIQEYVQTLVNYCGFAMLTVPKGELKLDPSSRYMQEFFLMFARLQANIRNMKRFMFNFQEIKTNPAIVSDFTLSTMDSDFKIENRTLGGEINDRFTAGK